jgi:hypothetical protein
MNDQANGQVLRSIERILIDETAPDQETMLHHAEHLAVACGAFIAYADSYISTPSGVLKDSLESQESEIVVLFGNAVQHSIQTGDDHQEILRLLTDLKATDKQRRVAGVNRSARSELLVEEEAVTEPNDFKGLQEYDIDYDEWKRSVITLFKDELRDDVTSIVAYANELKTQSTLSRAKATGILAIGFALCTVLPRFQKT